MILYGYTCRKNMVTKLITRYMSRAPLGRFAKLSFLAHIIWCSSHQHCQQCGPPLIKIVPTVMLVLRLYLANLFGIFSLPTWITFIGQYFGTIITDRWHSHAKGQHLRNHSSMVQLTGGTNQNLSKGLAQ